jgi:hypothetical protein
LRTGCWRIFGPKRDEVMREWSKLHNEELRDLYSTPSIIRIIKDEMGGSYSTYGGEEDCILVIGGKARGIETSRKTKT